LNAKADSGVEHFSRDASMMQSEWQAALDKI
jgi:hypothetical protein